jgi:hypothetical protein
LLLNKIIICNSKGGLKKLSHALKLFLIFSKDEGILAKIRGLSLGEKGAAPRYSYPVLVVQRSALKEGLDEEFKA